MPQMMPINWIFSFIFFILIFITFNIINYYIFHMKKNFVKNKMTQKLPSLYWKW